MNKGSKTYEGLRVGFVVSELLWALEVVLDGDLGGMFRADTASVVEVVVREEFAEGTILNTFSFKPQSEKWSTV